MPRVKGMDGRLLRRVYAPAIEQTVALLFREPR